MTVNLFTRCVVNTYKSSSKVRTADILKKSNKRIRELQLDNVQDLHAALLLRREWDRVPLRYVRRLVLSMTKRCVAILNANSGLTHY